MEISNFNMDYFSLKGKNAIVTGGNSGLGRAFSLAVAKAGANVLIPSVEPDDLGFDELIEAEGVKVIYTTSDITEQGIPEKITKKCVDELGSVDILINCAGILITEDAKKFGRKEWDPMVAVNLTASFEMIHACSKYMIEQQSGKIINICSLYSFMGGKWSPAYAATKHGIAGLTKAYCDELAEYNIQVNGIAPGFFNTKVAATSANDPERSKWIVDHTPANRWGEVLDLMGTTVFLASRASQFVNGHILVVDGGFLTR